jgi:hypothetical protein
MESWTLNNQVLFTPKLTSTFKLTLNILSHGRRNEDIFAYITTAIAFPQVAIPSLVSLYSGYSLTPSVNIMKSNRSCTTMISKAVALIGCLGSTPSGWEKLREELANDGLDGW